MRTRSDLLERGAECGGEGGGRGGEPARRVEQGDQVRGDQPLARGPEGEPELLGEMLAQGVRALCHVLDPVLVGLEGPAGAAAAIGVAAAVGRAAGVIGLGVLGIEGGGFRRGHGLRAHQRRGVRLRRRRVGALVGRRNLPARAVLRLVLLEQRVALQLLGDEACQIEVRELQELDRLPELRRHHQRGGLADLQARSDGHGRPSVRRRPDAPRAAAGGSGHQAIGNKRK